MAGLKNLSAQCPGAKLAQRGIHENSCSCGVSENRAAQSWRKNGHFLLL